MTTTPNSTVVVIGSANMDLVVHAPRFPVPGQTVIGSSFATFEGGKGANQAVAAARYGAQTSFLAALGMDDHAAALLAALSADHVNCNAVTRRADVPTGVAVITVNDTSDGENTIVVAPGANATLSPEDVRANADLISSACVLLMQLEIPIRSVHAAAQIAHSADVTVILNAAPVPGEACDISAIKEMADLIDLLIVNETECAALAGQTPAGDTIPDTLPFNNVVLTLGARGSVARWNGSDYRTPAFPVTPVDTTAAGDAFCGVLAAALAGNCPFFPDALRHASAAGALASTRPGAQPSLPYESEIRGLAESTGTNG